MPRPFATYLDGKRLLLVLDNLEHLLDAAPMLAGLLGALPELTILATSREPLRLRGEREFRVPPLSLPDARLGIDVARLGESEAVTLFVERAREARVDFVLTETNAPTVAAICRRLDGLPLALELAAARVRNLSLGALLARLEQSLPLLTSGTRDAPARHRTLRTTIGWSYDLLPPEEQALFRRLDVFAGGWTLEAVEAICPSDGGPDVLTALGSLTDKNLVWLDESGMAPRYRMLETIREFAAERLGQHAEEGAALRRVHAAFFAALAGAAESGLCAGVMTDVLRVEADLDNLRAALTWLLAAGDSESALPMAATLSEYWTFAGGQYSEGRGWLERSLAFGATASASARAGGHYGLATMALHQGDLAAARVASTKGLALARSAPDARWIAANAYMLSTVERIEGRVNEALALAREAEAAARASGKAEWVGWSRLLVGAARHSTGDFAGAVTASEEALETFRRIDGRWGEAFATESLALAVRSQGDLRRAAALHARGVTLRHEIGSATGIENDFIGLADLACDAGNFRVAAMLLGAVEAHEARFGIAPLGESPAIGEHILSEVKDWLGAAAFQASWAAGHGLSHDDAVAEALAFVTTLSQRDGKRRRLQRAPLACIPKRSRETSPASDWRHPSSVKAKASSAGETGVKCGKCGGL